MGRRKEELRGGDKRNKGWGKKEEKKRKKLFEAN